MTTGELANANARSLVETRRHKLHQRLAVVAEDAERRVAGTDHFAGRVHHLLQDVVELMAGEDRNAGGQQPLESFPDAVRFEAWGHT